MLAALGRSCARRRWPVLGVWLVLTAAGLVLGGQVFDRLATTGSLRPDAESQLADRQVDRLRPEGPVVVAVVGGHEVYDRALVDDITAVTGEIRAMDGVTEVEDLYSAPGGRIGADNRSSLIRVELDRGLPDDRREQVEDAVAGALHRIHAPEVLVGGEKLAERAFADQAIADAAFGESVAIVVLLLVLALILGGFVAGAIPLAAALATVSVTLLGLFGLTAFTGVSEFTVNVVTLLGIGLAVDYALLVIARFRQEREADPDAPVADLVARTTATAGRTVLISGLAVGAAMAGLFAFAEPLLGAMALGGAVAVLLATLAGLTAVPALIATAHRRIPGARDTARVLTFRRAVAAVSRRRAEPGPGLLARLAAFAQARPAPVALAVTAGLLALSLPFLFAVNLENSDARALPASAEARRLQEAVQRDFSGGQADPIVVVVDADPAGDPARDFMNVLNTLNGVLRVEPRPDVAGPAAIIDVTPEGETAGRTSRDVVRAIRALDPPFPVLVGGAAAELADYRDSVVSRFPLALLIVVLSTAVLLFVLTGSLVMPVKALLMNALTLLATLGALVVVFQWGVGDALLGFDSWGAIDVTTPVLLFVFVFGLSMDYEVFLLARIKEEWDGRPVSRRRTPDGDHAVRAGIEKSGPVVTAAALCIGVVFLGFLLGDLIAVKEIGFAMAVALLLDVTVVRGLLLPAVMSLLGEWNWWAPAPLNRLHQRWFSPRAGGPEPAAAPDPAVRAPHKEHTHR
ncbi:efflux RND transporter permease subunit [Actinoplanes sp. NEAU-A12]|uniref:Efflux RND transporter permease subunit n=1 Tax=Actinoplanes sandaracinus TaxID=3045177 RepID=A0ABT6WTT1_9ACTN|nr:efflux RND transporter permease subunit [Actinoplanes sandaracinus]MDI6103149.1 efflux RND transporter permease subunit [Actinoplanes sandaracinus]